MPTDSGEPASFAFRVEVRQTRRATAAVLLFAVGLAVVRIIYPERPMDYIGPRALLDGAFAIGLVALVLTIATGLGLKTLRWLRIDGLTHLERGVLTAPIGLGILSLGMLALGLVGWFTPGPILLWVVLALLWSSSEAGAALARLWRVVGESPQWWARIGLGERALWLVVLVLMLVSLPQALMPPSDYDGLTYHLQAPRLFLEAGRISILPEVWTANYPLTIEMLFAVGLVAGCDTFARLLPLALTGLLFAGTYAFARRHLGRTEAVLAVGALVGSPILWTVAAGPYTDLTWALFEFLAVYALVFWRQDRNWRWLVLAGVFCGFALGTKYIALVQCALAGAWLLWESRRDGFTTIVRRGVALALPAAVIAAPWYIKNWLWAGNPVYPLAFGGIEWPMDRLHWLNVFLGSFGTGRGITDYLMLPWNIYAQSRYFGPPLSELDWPNPLFLLALLYPLRRRTRVTNLLAALAVARFAAWAGGVQVTRYLAPIFPLLSIVTASVLTGLTAAPALRRLLFPSVIGIGVAVALLYQSLFTVVGLPAVPVSIGLQSKDSFLDRFVPPYRLQKVLDQLAPNRGRVFVLWDGRGYYRDSRYLLDAEQSRWTQWVLTDGSPTILAARLRSLGVTHVLFSIADARWMVENHDPTNLHMQAADFYWERFVPACGRELYSDKSAHLIELTCP